MEKENKFQCDVYRKDGCAFLVDGLTPEMVSGMTAIRDKTGKDLPIAALHSGGYFVILAPALDGIGSRILVFAWVGKQTAGVPWEGWSNPGSIPLKDKPGVTIYDPIVALSPDKKSWAVSVTEHGFSSILVYKVGCLDEPGGMKCIRLSSDSRIVSSLGRTMCLSGDGKRLITLGHFNDPACTSVLSSYDV